MGEQMVLDEVTEKMIAGGEITRDQGEQVEENVKKVFGMSLMEMGKNHGKPMKCKGCGKDYIPFSDQAWNMDMPYEFQCCFQCGYEKAKKTMGTPKPEKNNSTVQLWDADLYLYFQYPTEILTMMISSSSYIYGPTGTGKTFLGFAICHSLLQLDRGRKRIIFEEFRDITRKMKQAHKPFGYRTEEQLLRKYIDADILFLDEVMGSREDDKPSDMENECLYDLIRVRNNRKAQTIITSNFDLKQLEQKGFSARTTSRIAELCQVVNLDGVDRRLKVVDEV